MSSYLVFFMKLDRSKWMSILSKSSDKSLANLFQSTEIYSAYKILKKPEIGSVMVRGKIGGTGELFNVGEVTITRCSILLNTGKMGFSYIQGRNKKKAITAAICDALMQTHLSPQIRNKILIPLIKEEELRKKNIAKKAKATKVDFFTLVRGDNL